MLLADLGASLTPDALRACAPMIVVSAGVLVALMAEVVPLHRAGRRAIFPATILLALVCDIGLLRAPLTQPVLAGTYLADRATASWSILFLASALLTWCFARRYYREERPFLMEHDALVLCAVVGMMLMAGALDLLSFFIGLELLSVPLYALAAFQRRRALSVEAGLKYFLLGAFSAGLYLYGAALAYAATGSIRIADFASIQAPGPLFVLGAALLASSLFFKISVFPFHFWVPDVYQGSPTPIAGFMATGTKAAAFAFLLNAVPVLPRSAAATVALVALATMAVGNLGALVQADLKRMLAYSSVAHAGTILLVVAAALASGGALHADAVGAAIFYMAAYVFTAGGAFGLVALLEADGERFTRIDSLRGLARRRPAVAAAMTLFLLSLGGIPATGGFLGKYLVFSLAVRADLVLVAVLGVLLSVIALAYYLRVVVAMYMQPEPEGAAPSTTQVLPASLGAAVCAVAVVLLGILPGIVLERLS